MCLFFPRQWPQRCAAPTAFSSHRLSSLALYHLYVSVTCHRSPRSLRMAIHGATRTWLLSSDADADSGSDCDSDTLGTAIVLPIFPMTRTSSGAQTQHAQLDRPQPQISGARSTKNTTWILGVSLVARPMRLSKSSLRGQPQQQTFLSMGGGGGRTAIGCLV